MKIIRTLILSLIAAMNISFAGEMDGNKDYPKKWVFGADALYLQPDVGILDIRGLQSDTLNLGQYRNYAPNYNWGFVVNGSYYLNLDNDVTVEWYHSEHSTKRSFGAILSVAGDYLSSASGSIDPSWNAVNFEIAQNLHFTDRRSARLHAGVEYAQIATDESRTVVLATSSLPNYASINRVYNGFGPRIGATLSQSWMNGFDIYGSVATAILIGTQSSETEYVVKYLDRSISRSAIVPELELKLGADYQLPSTSYGQVTLNAGWMWVNYFNASLFDNYNLALSGVNMMNVDFGVQGLFFGFKWSKD